MALAVEQFERKSFPVDAVRVTVANMEEVAVWCDGDIKEETDGRGNDNVRFIKVRVQNPLTEKQTKAYVGDWILYAGRGYKVYTDKALRKNFTESGVPQPVKRQPLPKGLTAHIVATQDEMDAVNVFEENGARANLETAGTTASANPGGTTSV